MNIQWHRHDSKHSQATPAEEHGIAVKYRYRREREKNNPDFFLTPHTFR
jgi:hypothetical protein